LVPDPLDDAGKYSAAITELVVRWRTQVVIPISDASALALLPSRAELEAAGARLPFPSEAIFREISDKAVVFRAAGRVGIQVPQQTALGGPAIAPDDLRFPVVVKPARSVVERDGKRLKTAVAYASDGAELNRLLTDLPVSTYPVLLQERIVGPGVGIFVFRWDGQVRAVFAHRRIREKPPSGGVSVYRESIPADPALVRRSIALLESFQWQGVAMVEYKLDERTGEAYLMEINGRFWGSLQLAIDSGVDFPRLLLSALAGEPGMEPTTYQVGVRSRWWWGDVDHVLLRWKSGGGEGRWRALWDFVASTFRSGREESTRYGDLRPFVRETLQWIRGR